MPTLIAHVARPPSFDELNEIVDEWRPSSNFRGWVQMRSEIPNQDRFDRHLREQAS